MQERFVALVSGFGWHVQDLQRASGLVGCRLDAMPFPELNGRVGNGQARIMAGGIDLGASDGVLVRMMPPGTLEQVVFRMDALQRLEVAGVPILNPPRAIEAAVDKYLALAKLEAGGLPVPPTWVGESADAALRAARELGGDVVIKPLFGSEGRGLIRASDPELIGRAVRTLERLGSVLYLQRFIPHEGHDLRAFVLGGRVVAAIRRFARRDEWRTNISLGGRAEAVDLDTDCTRLALAAAEAVGVWMAGVDLLPEAGTGRHVVLEVNAVPGWRALAGATGVDVAAEILQYLRRIGSRR